MTLEQLKEKHPLIYAAAKRNTSKGNIIHECDPVDTLFYWDTSPEGKGFWMSVFLEDFEAAKELQPHLFKEPKRMKINMGLIAILIVIAILSLSVYFKFVLGILIGLLFLGAATIPLIYSDKK